MNAVPHYVDRLFRLLDEAGVAPAVLVRLEFRLLPILKHGERGPRAIRAAAKTDAKAFVALLCLAYRAEDEDAVSALFGLSASVC